MLIQRMSAVFGRLRNETLQLQDGLNIIEAPNETGKSTWCAFLTAMLYGINSRERDKAGFIADKNRYAPWDGGSMSGRLECHADGADLTLTRATRRQTGGLSSCLHRHHLPCRWIDRDELRGDAAGRQPGGL